MIVIGLPRGTGPTAARLWRSRSHSPHPETCGVDHVVRHAEGGDELLGRLGVSSAGLHFA